MAHKRRVNGPSAAAARTPGARWRWVVLCAAAAGVVLLVMLWAAALQRKVHRELSQPAMHPEGFGLHLPVMHTSAPGGVGEQAAAAAAEAVTAASEMQALQPAVAAAAAAAGWLPQPVQVTVTRLDASLWRVKRDAVASSSSRAEAAQPTPPPPPPPPASQQRTQTAPQAAPKVALLFLTASAIANEAVWRAFFERAAELQLQPAVAAAVAAAAQPTAPDAASLAAALGPGRTLHPDVGVFPPWAYPGYRVQHSLMAGADASSTAAAAAAVQKVTAAAAGTRGSPTPAASDSAALTFPAAAQARESGLLHAEIQRLLRQPSPVSSSATPVPKSSSPGQQGALWSAYTQPSTLRDALAAAGLPQPAAVLNSTVLMAQHTARAVQVDPARCAASLSAAHAGGQPPLFSVYVHTPVGQLLPASSLLSGCELRVRLNTTHGYAQHVLAEAEALLLWAALSDPLNTKFVFVSDSSIPLYPPQLIWSQLMFERRSRLDACITPGRDTQLSSRWRHPMATPQFGPQHWRKSSQWATLQRQHALLAVSDNHVREMLHRYCYTGPHSFPICVSDEHWLPSLLASYGLDSQTDGEGATHYADWSGGGWHPKSFQSQDLTPRLVHLMRLGIPSAVWLLSERPDWQQQFTSQPGTRQLQGIAQADARVVQQQQQQPLSAAVLAARQQARIATAKAAIKAAGEECNATRTIASASAVLGVRSSRQVPDAAGSSSEAAGQPADGRASILSGALSAAGFEPLGSACPLFARKFPEDAANATLAMALSCAGLGLGRWC